MQFAIHESNIERLQKKVARIQNKCTKYGCDFHYAEVGEEFRTREVGAPEKHTITERYILVEAEGTAKVNGWEFAATLEHQDGGNIIRQFAEGLEIPERYRTCDAVCEHCQIRRPRKDTYIVYNAETKEFKQVGSSCLCDFTGGLSAEAVASYISLFDEMIVGEAPSEGYTTHQFFDIDEVLKYTVVFVAAMGYRSAQNYDTTTKGQVIEFIHYREGRANRVERENVEEFLYKYHPNFDSEEVAQKVVNIRNFIRTSDEDSSFMHNLKVLEASGYTDYRNIGFTVAMVPCYNKHVEKIERKAREEALRKSEAEASNFLGQVGDKLVIEVASMTVITSWDTMYGMTTRFKIVDKSGNVCMWDSSAYVDHEKDIRFVRGTVKKLDTYNGVKQTWLTRCRVEYAPEEKKEVQHEAVESRAWADFCETYDEMDRAC